MRLALAMIIFAAIGLLPGLTSDAEAGSISANSYRFSEVCMSLSQEDKKKGKKKGEKGEELEEEPECD